MIPAIDLFDDAVGIDDPDKGFGSVVVLAELAVDRGLEVDARTEEPCGKRRRVRVAKKPRPHWPKSTKSG